MQRRGYNLEIGLPKCKYSFNDKTFNLNLNASLDSRLPLLRNKSLALPATLGAHKDHRLELLLAKSVNNEYKLPILKRRGILNPEASPKLVAEDNSYYQSKVSKGLKAVKDTNYMLTLSREHFLQTIEALRIARNMKVAPPSKEIKLAKRNPHFKTVYLDLDETLIHCDQTNKNYTVQLQFPIEGNVFVTAGIRVRPHCAEFLTQLSSFAEIIIFTASSSSYADVVLDYLDPQKKYFSHRLYRQHCTVEKGFYTKDLRIVNRRPEDSVLVDNSAYSFMMSPKSGIPVLPFYHFAKDKELPSLLGFLKRVLGSEDVREQIGKVFFWEKYLSNESDPKQIFLNNYSNQSNDV